MNKLNETFRPETPQGAPNCPRSLESGRVSGLTRRIMALVAALGISAACSDPYVAEKKDATGYGDVEGDTERDFAEEDSYVPDSLEDVGGDSLADADDTLGEVGEKDVLEDIPEDGVPGDGLPEDGLPEDGVPEDGVPGDTLGDAGDTVAPGDTATEVEVVSSNCIEITANFGELSQHNCADPSNVYLTHLINNGHFELCDLNPIFYGNHSGLLAKVKVKNNRGALIDIVLIPLNPLGYSAKTVACSPPTGTPGTTHKILPGEKLDINLPSGSGFVIKLQ